MELEFVDTSKRGLKEEFIECCLNPETNSGHYRGSIAALLASKYGMDTYMKVIEEAILEKIS